MFSKKDSIENANELLVAHLNFINLFTLDLFTTNEEKAILAQGELLSTALLHLYMTEQNISSVLLPALDFMRIDESEETESPFIKKMISKTLQKFGYENLFITQGYIGRNSFGEIDNLKLGGSDYTVTLIGAAVNANEIQIWTDIDGQHNNDPRIVEKLSRLLNSHLMKQRSLHTSVLKFCIQHVCFQPRKKTYLCAFAQYHATNCDRHHHLQQTGTR